MFIKKKISFPSKRFQNRQNSEPANSILRMMNGNRSETLILHFQALRSSNTLQKKKSICQTRRWNAFSLAFLVKDRLSKTLFIWTAKSGEQCKIANWRKKKNKVKTKKGPCKLLLQLARRSLSI